MLLGAVSGKKVAFALTAVIVVGGIVLALTSSVPSSTFGPASQAPVPGTYVVDNGMGPNFTYGTVAQNAVNGVNSGPTQVLPGTETITVSSTTSYATTTGIYQQGVSSNGSTVSQGSPRGSIEFSSDLNLKSSNPEQTASGVVALAYSVGGYVAYQSTYSDSANVVIRVPADQYQAVLTRVEAMGTVVSLTSNSNDVQVQYSDLNATLASLRGEQGALLKLLNESSTINSTLAIETQLQGVNAQINEVQSQILQTRTLIDYSTIDITVEETAQPVQLSVALSASPRSGLAPLSVTFNALVKGGTPSYYINYNFGDGYSTQGQTVIHTFSQAGDYNVSVGVTDQSGNTTSAWTMVHVSAVSAQSGIGAFLGNVGGLFLGVVEGIVEVAVVVLPIAAVAALVVIPIQRRSRSQRAVRQSQQA